MNATASTSASPAAAGSEKSETRTGVQMTSRAAKIMRDQITKRGNPKAVVRFGIRGGGCTGFSYLFEFDDRGPRDNDHVVEKDGVTMVVDPKSMFYVDGTIIDFETGIRGHGFKFDNPQVDDSCGCGESISF